jgi:uncharacterized protein YqjF (DUF2071 family)
VTLQLLETPARQGSSLEETEHRPWPLPEGRPWIMAQTLDDLLFAHWRVSADAVRALLPAGLDVDERDGSAWLGVTPFVVTGLRAHGLLPIPRASSFRELNVRTYVIRDGRPGIWFLSLDASSHLAVAAARLLYRLPYFHADVLFRRHGARILFDSARDEGTAFSVSYEAKGSAAPPAPGSLEEFLTERYCLYVEHDGRLYRAEIHHRPWPLQPVDADIQLNTMLPASLLLEGDPLFHYSARQDVVIWALVDVSEADA